MEDQLIDKIGLPNATLFTFSDNNLVRGIVYD